MSENEKIELSKKILAGIRKAQLKLFERKAKLGESVVIGDENGLPQSVSASEILKQFKAVQSQ